MLPANGDQQEQQQEQQSLTFPTTDDAADPSFDPSRSEARQRPDQRASKQAKASYAAQEQCCTQCRSIDSTPDQGELVSEMSYLPPGPPCAVELPGDSKRALAPPSTVAAEREAWGQQAGVSPTKHSSWLRLIAITLPSISWSCQGRQRWRTRALWSARR
jgi:hypothetical protein